MGARDLLESLSAINVKVIAEDGRLHVRPSNLLTPELRAALIASKPDLLLLAPRRHWRVKPSGRPAFNVVCVQGATADEIRAQWPGAEVDTK